MIVFEVSGLKSINTYYCEDINQIQKALKLIQKDGSIRIRKIEMTEEEYNKILEINIVDKE